MPRTRGVVKLRSEADTLRKFKKGIYLTSYGEEAYVSGPWAKTAINITLGERIPMSEVTTKFLREVEDANKRPL